MSDTTKLELGSKEQVAYDLMLLIAKFESEGKDNKWLKPDPRTYYLKLFNQCIRASVSNASTGYIVGND